MLGKITKTAVERLQPDSGWLWDSEVKGFGARRQVDGVFYYLRYRVGGAQRVKSIGRHGSPWTPTQREAWRRKSSAKSLLALIRLPKKPRCEPLRHWAGS